MPQAAADTAFKKPPSHCPRKLSDLVDCRERRKKALSGAPRTVLQNISRSSVAVARCKLMKNFDCGSARVDGEGKPTVFDDKSISERRSSLATSANLLDENNRNANNRNAAVGAATKCVESRAISFAR